MVNGALPLLPVATTKVGPGDKERAYVVRQNVVLKTLLIAFSVVSGLGVTLCCTVYEVHVQRRTSLDDAREHREEEHTSHMRIMRLSTVLQQRLKDEVHDMSVLTTYRAWLLRAVGDYQNHVVKRVSSTNCSDVEAQLKTLGTAFDQQVDGLLKRLWDDLVREGKAAQTQLHNITAAIMSELKQDASEAADFEQLMAAAGELPRPLSDSSDHGGDGPADDHSSLGMALEAFHARLLLNDSIIVLNSATLARWQKQYDTATAALGDQDSEADMLRIAANINALLEASHVPPFNASTHASEMDYFSDLMYRAKLAPFRNELLALLDDWKAGVTTLAKPLNRVEELIDMNVLQPDVLLVSPEDYQYDETYGDDS
eukprot:CAMPEP_0119312598 /NCGR_PEP_ID=MMETSP1333-20130426/26903_1 /TAXON_ID=418940 /ORGANISM="Scyphosphaera apsteinii, Strain RCC1455" /LENGTH=370 /DNA_ID=CAMNT_0007317247 /DNA_START=84 /DNA_END=1196 /DNA_ORIENTATION=-